MYQHKQYAVFIFFVLAWIGGFVALAWNLLGADGPLIIFTGILVLVGFLFHGLTVKVDDKKTSPSFLKNGIIGLVGGFILSVFFFLGQNKLRTITRLFQDN